MRGMLVVLSAVAVTLVLVRTRPHQEDFQKAEAFQKELLRVHHEYYTVYAGLDPTATWSSWFERVPIVCGLFCSLLLLCDAVPRGALRFLNSVESVKPQ